MNMNKELHFLGVDCSTSGKKLLIHWLKLRKEIIATEDRGEYREDRSYTKLWVDATVDEKGLEELLDAWRPLRADAEVFGTFTRQNHYKKDGYLFDQLDARPIGQE